MPSSSLFHEAPVVTIWEVTQACDLTCQHCRASARPSRHPLELSTVEGLNLIDQAANMGSRLFVFSGGDPLKRADLPTLIGHAAVRGLHPAVTPSATPLLTRTAIQRLAESGAEAIAISIDGDNASLHDTFRGWQGSFDHALAAAAYVREASLTLQINTTVSRVNAHRLPQMASLVEHLGARRWSLFFLVPVGRGATLEMLSPKQHEEVFQWLAELQRRVRFAVKTTEAPAFRRVLRERGYPQRLPVTDGKGFCFISHIGEVFPSGFLPLSGGNLRHQALAEIYRNSPLFRSLRDPLLLKGRCGRCHYRDLCGGSRARAYALTGDYLEEDASCLYQP